MNLILSNFGSLTVRINLLLRGRASLGSPPLKKHQVEEFARRAQYAKMFVSEREKYLAQPGVDAQVFGTHWGREYLDTVAALIASGDQRMLDRLRLVYNFSGFPIVGYRRRETFPTYDPVFERYLRLRALTPRRLRFSAPAMCGEAGWKIDGGLVNVDVALAQERVQFMHFSGALDWLDAQPQPISIVEIGAGCGLMALALLRAYPKCRYVICDVPEVLAVSFAYLNIAMPAYRHVAALPSGSFDVATRESVDISKLGAAIVYMPNYMLHRHAPDMACDMAVNAMSLHEMRPAQIDFYSRSMARWVAARNGIYFDINAHRGHENKVSDPFLQAAFAHRQNVNLEGLSLAARVWSNAPRTMESLSRQSARYREQHDLEKAFAIEKPFEVPRFSAKAAHQTLNEDLGQLLGVDFESWMKARRYGFADPLAGYRVRHGLS
jgi:hypothetical protein